MLQHRCTIVRNISLFFKGIPRFAAAHHQILHGTKTNSSKTKLQYWKHEVCPKQRCIEKLDKKKHSHASIKQVKHSGLKTQYHSVNAVAS